MLKSLALGLTIGAILLVGFSSEATSKIIIHHYVNNQSCLGIDTTPPATPGNLRVSKATFLRRVGLLSAPTLMALPLTEPTLRPGWVILRIAQLDLNTFPVACASSSNDCFGADRYAVEEYSGAGPLVIAEQNLSPTSPRLDLPLFRGLYGETRSYKVRFYPGAKSMKGCVLDTPMSGVVQIPDKVKVQIRNNLTATTNNDLPSDSKIVRVRVAADAVSLTKGQDPEKLTKDGCQPENATVDQVISGGAWPATGSFYVLDDGQGIDTPFLHIGLGDWAKNDAPCGGPNQRKRPFSHLLSGEVIFRYVEFNLSRRFGETVITFSSDAGNVNVSMAALNSGNVIAPAKTTLQSTSPNSDPITP